jgi:hypothetical protein
MEEAMDCVAKNNLIGIIPLFRFDGGIKLFV